MNFSTTNTVPITAQHIEQLCIFYCQLAVFRNSVESSLFSEGRKFFDLFNLLENILRKGLEKVFLNKPMNEVTGQGLALCIKCSLTILNSLHAGHNDTLVKIWFDLKERICTLIGKKLL